MISKEQSLWLFISIFCYVWAVFLLLIFHLQGITMQFSIEILRNLSFVRMQTYSRLRIMSRHSYATIYVEVLVHVVSFQEGDRLVKGRTISLCIEGLKAFIYFLKKKTSLHRKRSWDAFEILCVIWQIEENNAFQI